MIPNHPKCLLTQLTYNAFFCRSICKYYLKQLNNVVSYQYDYISVGVHSTIQTVIEFDRTLHSI